jgi:hypothetical protein
VVLAILIAIVSTVLLPPKPILWYAEPSPTIH